LHVFSTREADVKNTFMVSFITSLNVELPKTGKYCLALGKHLKDAFKAKLIN